MHHAISAITLLAIGCASSTPEPKTGRPLWTRPVMAPDGSQAHIVVCANRIGRCYDRAEWVCPEGYQPIDRGGRVDVGRGVAHTFRGPFGVRITRYRQRRRTVHELVIKCRGYSYIDIEESDPISDNELTDEECLTSDWCKQLGRCRARDGKCARE